MVPAIVPTLALLRTHTSQQLTCCQSQGMPCRPDIQITTWSDSPDENVLTLCRVSRILLLLISGGGGGAPIYDLYRDVPLDRVLYVQFQDFNSPEESIKQQTDPYGRATKK